MTQLTIANTNAADMTFDGEMIGEVDNRDRGNNGPNSTRWTELTLYKLSSGRYVCQRSNHSQWVSEETTHVAVVLADMQGVIEFFGYCDLAKSLYLAADIDAAQKVS